MSDWLKGIVGFLLIGIWYSLFFTPEMLGDRAGQIVKAYQEVLKDGAE